MNTPPTIGRIVHYTLTEGDATAIRHAAGTEFVNPIREGTIVAGLVVAVFDTNPEGPGTANLRLTVDGSPSGDIWVTSRMRSETGEPEPGRWNWPPRA